MATAAPPASAASGPQWKHFTVRKEHVDVDKDMSLEVATIVEVAPAGGRELRFEQRMGEDNIAPLFDGSAWAGTVIWEASIALAEEAIDRFGDDLRRGARVLELGCGLGFPGLACAALGAKTTVTDVPEVFELLERNVALNFPPGALSAGEPHGSGEAGGGGTARAVALRWDVGAVEALAREEGGAFDLVLCADCVYQPLYGESWKGLADCTTAMCRDGRTSALVSVQRRHNDGVPGFLDRLSAGLRVERVSLRMLPDAHLEIFSARRPRDGEAAGLLL